MTTRSRPVEGLGFWPTVRLLLVTARRRAVGRQKRRRELLRHRTKRQAIDWGPLGYFLTLLLGLFLNGTAAFLVYSAVSAGARVDVEQTGKIAVSRWFLDKVKSGDISYADLERDAEFESRHLRLGENDDVSAEQLRASVHAHGGRDFTSDEAIRGGLRHLPQAGSTGRMMGCLALLWWCVMIVFQGEGVELDLQRRRHPMWEWLFSHPVSEGAIFVAEMISPIAANPIYCAAPLFVGVGYGQVYGFKLGLLAGLIIGVPLTVAAACLGKALEIGAILRFPPRTRGAVIGIMGWIGYASMMLFLVGVYARNVLAPVAHFLHPLSVLPWPWLGWFLGQVGGSFSFLVGTAVCWFAAAATTAAAVAFSAWGAQQGLSGNFDQASMAPKGRAVHFGKDPLYRKELLWFMRDRSAIVQTILVPVTVAGFQLFNMRGLLVQAQSAWNFLCGAGILFGTYFLWVLGPKSLASEGPSLWISLTWPRGLESLLKAKAWLWSMISSAIVLLVLLYTAWVFPRDSWKVLLVGLGWLVFGRSMAEKTITLVRVPSSSGEVERPSRMNQWAASLGMMTFAIGILSQQWHIAIMGIVYSYITAAAMWENFRARLPYLYDPWSETIPPPPTLMHAMISISILVEIGAIILGVAVIAVGKAGFAPVQTVVYGICALAVSIGTWMFLKGRGVSARDVWCWVQAEGSRQSVWCGDRSYGRTFLLAMATGIFGGVLLGLFAHGYLAVISHIPSAAEILRKAQAAQQQFPGLRQSYFITAVFIAPFAEEYLFRGLLYRALDREWGGWRAVLGGAAFFAIYHPPLAWVPVGLLGAANALLFKTTGRLAPAVALHMTYNAVVLAW